jgi:AcrR family transcriptional regulator
MATRRYVSTTRASARTIERVLQAAEDLVAEDAFHSATMEDLAARAGVSRATVFSRFGSKVGVLEALSTRCAGGPEMAAIRGALALDDPTASLDGLIEASSVLWERQGYILIQLKAIVVLEPEASVLIDAQREEQRAGIDRIARGLAREGRLTDGWTAPRAAAALHALTSVELFLQLRREYGLPLNRVVQTIRELAAAIVS